MTFDMIDLTWEQFRDRVPGVCDLALVPVGTIEAHGAMALGTDTIIPVALAKDLAPLLNALIAPAIPYGVTNTLLPFPGSTTISSRTFATYLFEATAGLVDAGFRRVVLLNGHGGQSAEVGEVVSRLWNEKRAYAASVEWWGLGEEASREIYPGAVSGHAGVEETAMVLAIAPELVDPARATTIRRAPRLQGVRTRPFPASIILDRRETGTEGAPDLDSAKAKVFYGSVLRAVETALHEILAGWDDIRRP